MRPPRLARWILAGAAPAADRRFILADLQDEFEARAAAEGRRSAARWYWCQAFASARPLLAHRAGRAARRIRSRAPAPGGLLADARQAARWVLRHPWTSSMAAGTLAVAFAATLAAFMVIETVLLRPLPFPDAARIVRIDVSGPARPAGVRSASLQDVEDWRDRSRTFAAISAHTPQAFRLTGRGDPREIQAERVGPRFDAVLGLRAVAGRLFEPADFTEGGARAVILTQAFWQREFGRDPAAVGGTLLLDEQPYRIVGIVESTDVAFPGPLDAWVPLVVRAGAFWEASRGTGWVFPVGRIAPGAEIGAAQAELTTIAAQLAREHPRSNRDKTTARLTRIADELRGPIDGPLALLGAALALVLLIACANLATLLLASASRRRSEFAVRAALGAGRLRLARQIAIEAVLLAAAASIAALLAAPYVVRGFLALHPTPLPRSGAEALTGAALAAAAVLAALAVLVVAAPQILSVRPSAALLAGSGSDRTTVRTDRALGFGLIAIQVAFSVLLLVAGNALVRTVWKLQATHAGFRPDGVLTFSATPSPQRFQTAAASFDFYAAAIESLGTLPGVEAAAGVGVPLTSSGWRFGIRPRGADQDVLVSVNLVSPGYFDTLRIPIVEGRALTPAEQRSGSGVAMVNRALARILGEGGPVAGRAMNYSGQAWTIVGVAEDVRQQGPRHAPQPELFIPWHMAGKRPQALVVRAAGDPLALLPAIAARIRAIDPSAPLTDVATLEDRLRSRTAPERFRAALLALLALVAVGLAALGVYSVTSYAVARRTREFGIRLALGERPLSVLGRAMWTSVSPSAAGLIAGTTAVMGGARALESFLYEVDARDAGTVLLCGLALLLVAVVSAAGSARRVARLDPVTALRVE